MSASPGPQASKSARARHSSTPGPRRLGSISRTSSASPHDTPFRRLTTCACPDSAASSPPEEDDGEDDEEEEEEEEEDDEESGRVGRADISWKAPTCTGLSGTAGITLRSKLCWD